MTPTVALRQDRLPAVLSLHIAAPLTALGLYLVWSFLKFKSSSKGSKSRAPLPPGPKRTLPWVGNAFDLAVPEAQWLTFDRWTKQYGDVVYLEAFGTRIVVLGSLKACLDLFEKRSANYSERPAVPMLSELLGWGWLLSLMPYGEKWRKHRKTFHEFYNVNQSVNYRPVQIREARALLLRLLYSPDNFLNHLRHTLGATIMDVTYGIKVKEHNDPYIAKAEQALDRFSYCGQPGVYLVNTFPWLKNIPSWFPGAQFKRDTARWKPYAQDMASWPFQFVKDEMRQGTAKPSVASTLLERAALASDQAEAETIARNVAGIAYAGGADTTISGLQTFFLAMAMHPGVQMKAQHELDSVTGGLRLPDFCDQDSLPFISAICKEVMRWQVIVPLAMVHSSSADDEYNGYFLPKGTLFWGNAWAILHDPVEYPDPESFIPERFLKNGQMDPTVRDPNVAAFGFGRRTCPGRGLSDQALWSIVASVLCVYDIKPPVDAHGRPVALKPEMTTGLISYPKPFKCNILPRSPCAERLVRDFEMESH